MYLLCDGYDLLFSQDEKETQAYFQNAAYKQSTCFFPSVKVLYMEDIS